jgi:hypothetical protein
MAVNNQVYSLIVPAGSADFTAHTYTQIYASAAATPTINGQAIAMAAGSTLNLKIRSITGGTNCYLLGEMASVYSDTTRLGG